METIIGDCRWASRGGTVAQFSAPVRRDSGYWSRPNRLQIGPMKDNNRTGVTVLELLVALVILSAVTGLLVWPSIRFDDRLRVEAEAGRLLEAYREARHWALVGNTTAELVVTADSLTIRTRFGGPPTTVWQEPGPLRSGVSITPPSHLTAFTPKGLAEGAGNVAHVLTRGAARRQVVVSRLGRARVIP